MFILCSIFQFIVHNRQQRNSLYLGFDVAIVTWYNDWIYRREFPMNFLFFIFLTILNIKCLKFWPQMNLRCCSHSPFSKPKCIPCWCTRVWLKTSIEKLLNSCNIVVWIYRNNAANTENRSWFIPPCYVFLCVLHHINSLCVYKCLLFFFFHFCVFRVCELVLCMCMWINLCEQFMYWACLTAFHWPLNF